jgi:hypothetical protein
LDPFDPSGRDSLPRIVEMPLSSESRWADWARRDRPHWSWDAFVIAPAHRDDVTAVRPRFRAAHDFGEPGDPSRDLDVLAIGTTERDVLLEVAEQLGRLLHREVNVTRISPTDWDAGEDPFVRTLRSRPLIPIPVRGDGPEGDRETTGE